VKQHFLSISLYAVAATGLAATNIYQAPNDFVSEAFAGNPPAPKVLWLTGAVSASVNAILGHAPPAQRLRYWAAGTRSAWILEEIGKDKPITVGVVVDANRLASVKVLIFRESRGWEVHQSSFTEQFNQATLTDSRQLDRRIDGITGATLSVRAVTKLARLALYLHRQSAGAGDPP
jgi:hypothetical protein